MDATSSDSQDHLHSAHGFEELFWTEKFSMLNLLPANFFNSSLKQFVLNFIHNIIIVMKLHENFISFGAW